MRLVARKIDRVSGCRIVASDIYIIRSQPDVSESHAPEPPSSAVRLLHDARQPVSEAASRRFAGVPPNFDLGHVSSTGAHYRLVSKAQNKRVEQRSVDYELTATQ